MIINENDREELIQQYMLILMRDLGVHNLDGLTIVSEVLKDVKKTKERVAEIKRQNGE